MTTTPSSAGTVSVEAAIAHLPLLAALSLVDLIREHNPKPEGPTLTMSLDLSDIRNEMERLNSATKAFLEEYDRD